MTQWYGLDRLSDKRLGIGLMLASCAFTAAGDAIAKWLAASLPVGQIICIRGCIILALLLALRTVRPTLALRPRDVSGQLWRAFFFVMSTFLMIWSLKLLPLPVVSAISFAAPIIMTALAPWLLSEKVGVHRWSAVLVGFLGVLLIVQPLNENTSWIVLAPVASAVAGAFRDIATRRIARTESAASIVLLGVMATIVVGAFTAIDGWVVPTLVDVVLLVLLGLVHGTSYWMQVAAFRAAEAGLLAPFKYSLLLWAIVIAFLVWGYFPDAAVLVGSSVVIASGAYIWHREIIRAHARD